MLPSVGRTPRTPPELAKHPFTLDEALRAGISRSALRGKPWKRLGTGLYCARSWRHDAFQLLNGWGRLLPLGTTFAGATAGWLHGLDLDPLNPVEVAVPSDSGVKSRPGLTSRRCDLLQDETVIVRGLPATALLRTLLDLCTSRPLVEALVAVDAAVRLGLTDRVALWRYTQAARGRPGSARLRDLARLAEPAESPMETRLRWLLLDAGLPRPQAQTELRDGSGRFLGRVDLLYPSARLIIEFDGGNHRDRLVSDDRRQNLLTNAGYRLLRFTTAELKGRPDVVVSQVRAALGPDIPHDWIQTCRKSGRDAIDRIQTRGNRASA